MIEEVSRKEVSIDGVRYLEILKRKVPIFDEREEYFYTEHVEIKRTLME